MASDPWMCDCRKSVEVKRAGCVGMGPSVNQHEAQVSVRLALQLTNAECQGYKLLDEMIDATRQHEPCCRCLSS